MRALLLGIGMWLVGTAAFGLTYQVAPDGSGDYPTIQAAIDASSSGDTVLCGPGTYQGTGNRNIELPPHDITVRGEAGSGATIIESGYPYGGFRIELGQGSATVVEGFTILDARYGAVREVSAPSPPQRPWRACNSSETAHP